MSATVARYPLALRLRVMRFRANLSQANLARLTRISAKLISFYEAGRRVPDANRIEVLARACGMSSEEFDSLIPTPSDERHAKARQVRQCMPVHGAMPARTACASERAQSRRRVVDPLARFKRELDTAVCTSSSLAWFGNW